MKCKIYGRVPSKSNSYKLGRRGRGGGCMMYKGEALKKYESDFFLQCPFRGKKLVRFELRVDVFYTSNRLDLDNSAKIILDCLEGCGAIKNDRGCVSLYMRKFVDKGDPRIEIELKEM